MGGVGGGGGGGGVNKQVFSMYFFKLMQPQYFSIALLLFSLISPAMNKFVCALKKISFGRVASYACTESFICVIGKMVES